MKRFTVPSTVVAVALIAIAVLAPAGGAAAPHARQAVACVAAKNIEAIIDDSGSMSVTDPSTLRVKAIKLLINTLSPATSLGALEFGGNFFEGAGVPPASDVLFPSEAVGPNAASMTAAMEAKIHADNGGTDYNSAFALSDSTNPAADARIFLTDGGHDIGTYNNGHLVHKVPTYVIGFSTAISASEDQARLNAIATETGGHFYPLTDATQLQSVMNDIGAALTCQTPPQTFTDNLKQGASKTHTITVGAHTKALRIALTWASPLDKFTVSNLKITSHGRTLARAASHVKKLKVKTTTSETFTILQLSGLVKGKLSFKVKAATVGSGAPQVTLTTQVGKSS